MSRARRVAGFVAVGTLAATAVGAIPAAAYWTGFDTELHGTGAAAAGTINQGASPTAVFEGAHVRVVWGGSTLSTRQPVDGYIVTRDDASTGVAQTMLSDCTGTIAATSCVEHDVPVGNWTYSVTPVVGDHWRGPESVPSGAVQVGATVLSLDRTVIGPPLPTQLSGTLTGFGAEHELRFTLDGVTIAGSPAATGADGNATITGLTIPAGLNDGPHEITVVDDADGDAAHASFLIDTTAPTMTASISPAANAAGWNNTVPVTYNGVVSDGDGSGVAYVEYTDDGSDPTTSPTAMRTLVAPIATQTTTYRFSAVDRAGNASTPQTQDVKIDTVPPRFTVAFVDVVGGAYVAPDSPDGVPATPYYRGSVAGSLRFQVTPVPLGGSPIVSAGFTPLSADDLGITFDSSSVTTPAGGPYVSNLFSWEAGSTSTPSGTISVLNAAGLSAGDGRLLHNDTTAPTGGSVDAAGLVGSGGRYATSTTVSVAFTPGTDAGSGLADGSASTDLPRRLLRAAAPLTSANGTDDSTCGIYGSYVPVGGDDPQTPLADTVPADVTCYRYRYLVPDHVGNVATYQSPDVKVMTAASESVRPTTATITPVSGTSAQVVVGSTAYYNPARAGSFDVASSATSPAVGIALMTFPAIDGFTGGGNETTPVSSATYRTTYAWSDNAGSPSPGVQGLSATDNAGTSRTNAAAFSLVKDDVAPSGGSAVVTGLGGTGGSYSTSTTLSVVLAAGTDGGSGLAPAGGSQLLRASAALTSDGTSDGLCGVYGAYTQIGANGPTSPKSDTVPQDAACYRYRYVVSDAVGNQAAYTSADVKVDATPPPTPSLTFSNLSNVTTIGNAVFYRRQSNSGAFTVTASSLDTTSGTTGYGFPTLPGGWSFTSGGPGVRTYTWSSPNPTPPAASQAITATDHAGGQSTAVFSMSASTDGAAPSGGSVSYVNGYSTNTAVSVSFVKGTDSGSGLATTSGILQRSTATLSAGACGTFAAFATVATNPTSAYSDAVSSGCYKYRYTISDNQGNLATYTSASIATIDQIAPTNTVSITAATGAYSAFGGATLYYKGDAAGSFRYVDAVADAESGPASADFFAIATTGWSHAAETVSFPPGGPFTSTPYSWTPNPGTPSLKSLVGRDAAGKVWSAAISFTNDVTPPAASSITYADGPVTTAAVAVSVLNGTDSGSGVDPATAVLHRDGATLNTSTGACGTFPGTYATTVTLVGGSDTGVVTGTCYRYSTTLADRVGNVTTTTSASVAKVDTSGPKVTAITSQQTGGSGGNGRLEIGDRLVLTFNQSLATASVPSSFSAATESSSGPGATVLVTIPGITNGASPTGSTTYVGGGTTATFGGTVSLSNSGAATTVTITVTTLTGAATFPGIGTLALTPATTIKNAAGLAASGTFSTAGGFQLF
jgi:hypothetical protein